MAIQNWVFMRHDLLGDPAVLRIAMKLKLRPEETIGYLFKFWVWVDQHCADGKIHGVTLDAVESLLAIPNFLHLMCEVGWLEYENETIIIPNYERWLSRGAKARLRKSIENKEFRERHSEVEKKGKKSKLKLFSSSSSSSCSSSFSSNKEGESEGENFGRFWAVYPKKRRTKRKEALAAFNKAIKGGADPELLIAKAAEYSASPEGNGPYVAGPSPWLNQGRWDDDPAAWQSDGSTPAPVTFAAQQTQNNIRAINNWLPPEEIERREQLKIEGEL